MWPDLLAAALADLLLSASRGEGGEAPEAADADKSGSDSQAARRKAAEVLSPLFRRLRSAGARRAMPSGTARGLGIRLPVACSCPPSPHAPVAPPQYRCPRTAMSSAQKSSPSLVLPRLVTSCDSCRGRNAEASVMRSVAIIRLHCWWLCGEWC